MHPLRASPVFSLVVLLALGLFGFFGVVLLQPDLIVGLLGQSTAGHIAQHFRSPHHRIHDLTFAFLLGTAGVGLLAQLRTPSKNVAGQVMALVPFVGLVLALALTNTAVLSVPWVAVGALTFVATALHPTGRHLVRSLGVSRVNRVMLGLVVVAAVPLLAFASTNIGLQRAVADEHAALGHYGFMAAFGVTVVGVGLVASLRPDGWWLPAWVAGVLPALLGLASLVFPDVESGLGPVWAPAAIAWGVAFVAVAELTRDAKHPTPLGSRGVPPRPDPGDPPPSPAAGTDTGRPPWVYVSAAIAIGLALLFAVMHLIGGGLGPGDHIPSGGAGGQAPLASGRGNSGGVGGPAGTVAVTTLDTMAFEPGRIDVSAGETVTFHYQSGPGRAARQPTMSVIRSVPNNGVELFGKDRAGRGGGA